jgi:methylphosphotriester-DNA--protein-cysteine methyltransferase
LRRFNAPPRLLGANSALNWFRLRGWCRQNVAFPHRGFASLRRRVFRETVGVSPKAFAKITRFDRAVRAARADAHTTWASIAATAGYYYQAHLIAEFRAIAGVTPRALLDELRAGPPVG